MKPSRHGGNASVMLWSDRDSPSVGNDSDSRNYVQSTQVGSPCEQHCVSGNGSSHSVKADDCVDHSVEDE